MRANGLGAGPIRPVNGAREWRALTDSRRASAATRSLVVGSANVQVSPRLGEHALSVGAKDG